ncbi:hypothetical protein GLOIN_2v1871231 [Rhizophagus irregularis DAOM 181602=DAOM 197198]|nr:hypothetical protein GLOIN_2v1871231 [Rhizophagus irregularis DAOM 181602=DAOM 197198]
MVRKKGPVWDHFEILSNVVNSHPHSNMEKSLNLSLSKVLSSYNLSNRETDDIDLSPEDLHHLGYRYQREADEKAILMQYVTLENVINIE